MTLMIDEMQSCAWRKYLQKFLSDPKVNKSLIYMISRKH